MNKLTKATILTGALFAPFAANAVSVTWTSGNQEISGDIFYTQDGGYGVGEVSKIVNTDTSAVEYQAGVNPGYITYLVNATTSTGSYSLAGSTLLLSSLGGSLTFYNSATDIVPLITLTNITAASQDAQAQNLAEHSNLTGAGGMNSVWMNGTLNPVTAVDTFFTTYMSGYMDSVGTTCGSTHTTDPNCYKFLSESGSYQWSVNNTGFNFTNPLDYNSEATNQATWNAAGTYGFQNTSGNNVEGNGIPEPSMIAMLGLGTLALGLVRRRRDA